MSNGTPTPPPAAASTVLALGDEITATSVLAEGVGNAFAVYLDPDGSRRVIGYRGWTGGADGRAKLVALDHPVVYWGSEEHGP